MVASESVRLADVLTHLERIPREYQIATICNNWNGAGHVLDWEVEEWARARGNGAVIGFDGAADAVSYVKGHTVLAFRSEPSQRLQATLEAASRARDWYSRKYGKWNRDKIKTRVVQL